MLMADNLLGVMSFFNPISLHNRDRVLAERVAATQERRSKVAKLSAQLHRDAQNYAHGKNIMSASTADQFRTLGPYGDIMAKLFEDVRKRTVEATESGDRRFSIRFPNQNEWRDSYNKTQFPLVKELFYPGIDIVGAFIRDIDSDIFSFFQQVAQNNPDAQHILKNIPLPPQLKPFFEHYKNNDDLVNANKLPNKFLIDFSVNAYLYSLAICDACLPERARVISKILAANRSDFRQAVFKIIHQRLKKHKKGWKDICMRIPSEKDSFMHITLSTLWKGMNAKQITPLLLKKFCDAYHDVISKDFPDMGSDKDELYRHVYYCLAHMTVLDSFLSFRMPVSSRSGTKRNVFPFRSSLNKGLRNFKNYVDFARKELEARQIIDPAL